MRRPPGNGRATRQTHPESALPLAVAAGLVLVLVVVAPSLGGPDGALSSGLAVGTLLLVAAALALAAAAVWRSPARRGLVAAAVVASVLATVATAVVLVPAVLDLVLGS